MNKPDRDARVLGATLTFYDQTLGWLIHHHSSYARKTIHDLAALERINAIWKLAGESIAHAVVLVDLLRHGYTGQTWPTMRAIHEADRLLVAVTDPEEKRIPARWLADGEVKQREARAAEARQADRFAEQMREAGLEPIRADIAALTRQIYGPMSKAAHHQRSVVDEAIDHEARTMVYRTEPDMERRLAFVIFAGALMYEVLTLVGDALGALWGPTFYPEHVVPMLRRFEEVLEALDVFEVVRRFGL